MKEKSVMSAMTYFMLPAAETLPLKVRAMTAITNNTYRIMVNSVIY